MKGGAKFDKIVAYHIWPFEKRNFSSWLKAPFIIRRSLPLRNSDKYYWVSFLYFLEFWMVFISYFPNFLWFPFLKFFRYFFQKWKCLFILEKSKCFFLYWTLLLSDLNLICLNHQHFGIFFLNNKNFNNSFPSS